MRRQRGNKGAPAEVTDSLRALLRPLVISWSFVAVMRAWSGYHFSLADRAVGVPAVGEVVYEGGLSWGSLLDR